MKFNFFETWLHFGKIFMYGFIMMIAVELTFLFCNYSFQQNQKIGSLTILVISIGVGILVYGSMTMRARLADQF